MLGEPPPTEYDWKFELFGIPVRVHLYFWIVTVLLGLRAGSSTALVIWIFSVFVSILVHEFGHAFAIRYYGWSPRVVLHSFGGLAIYDPSFAPWISGKRPRKTSTSQILISLAGPAAGFALAGLIILLLNLSDYSMGIFPVLGLEIPLGRGDQLIRNENLAELIWQMLYINIFWGVLNLMPVYPLDGGQVARELFIANTNDGLRMSLQLSIATAILLAVVAFVRFDSMYMAIMFGYLGYLNYQQLNGPFGGYRW